MLRIDILYTYWILNGSFTKAYAMDAAQFLADILRKQGNFLKSNKAGVSLPNTLQQAKKFLAKQKNSVLLLL